MSFFNDCLTKIKSAVYGKDVRIAIHDALYYLNDNFTANNNFAANDNFIVNVVPISDDANSELHAALNKLGSFAYVFTSKSTEDKAIQVCFSGDGYAVPVYRLCNNNIWSEYVKINYFELGSDFSINNKRELVLSTAFNLRMLAAIESAVAEKIKVEDIIESVVAEQIKIEDISDSFLASTKSLSSKLTASGITVFKQGKVITGSMELNGNFSAGSTEEFIISDAYKSKQSIAIAQSLIRGVLPSIESNTLAVMSLDFSGNEIVPISFSYICE